MSVNPAAALRAQLAPRHPRGMLRWDASGRALLVSDAPRRADGAAFMKKAEALGLLLAVDNGLLYIDFQPAVYGDLLLLDRLPPRCSFFELQSLLYVMLARNAGPTSSTPDIALLRAALLACAQGETAIRAFVPILRKADAEALRQNNTASTRACAVLIAQAIE